MNSLWLDSGGEESLFCGLLLRFFRRESGECIEDVEKEVLRRRATITPSPPPRGGWDGSRPLNNATFEVTRRCNRRCTYCYFNGSGNPALAPMMPIGVAEAAIRFLRRRFPAVRSASFIGGEPLLNVPLIEFVVRSFEDWGWHPRYRLFTNGTMPVGPAIDPSFRYGIRWVVSLDGPKEIHDLKRGEGTYDRVSRTLDLLALEGIPFDLAATITPAHMNRGYTPSRLRSTLRSICPGAGSISVAPVCSPAPEERFSPKQLAVLAGDRRAVLREELASLRSHGVNGQVPLQGTLVHALDAYFSWSRDDRICTASATTKLYFGTDGRVYPCLLFSRDPTSAYDLERGVLPRASTFSRLNDKPDREECRDCFARYLCFGCPGAHLAMDPTLGVTGRGRRDLKGTCNRLGFYEEIIRFLLEMEGDATLRCRVRNALREGQIP